MPCPGVDEVGATLGRLFVSGLAEKCATCYFLTTFPFWLWHLIHLLHRRASVHFANYSGSIVTSSSLFSLELQPQ